MIVSLNWLKEYVDLKGLSTDEIVDALTNCGLEVEEVNDLTKKYENFVIGFVKEVKKHPNADKLSLCIVDDGTREYNVVCGAPNVAADQKIVFAKIGAVIPNGQFEIKKAKIRGESSEGMICAEDELGLSEDHSGIMVLNDELETGQSFADALGLNDVQIEIAITPNRADALSHIGVARDLAAIFDRELKIPEISMEESAEGSSEFASVEIIDADKCPRYVGKVLRNVEIKESPDWLKKRLTSIGSRPINNVVDVTNFVLHEIGQPLHAFDLDQLAGNKIIVKTAGSDEQFTTLDSKERKMLPDDLMICDGEKPVAIAGVMGGENSEVTVSTKNILIESAYFDASSVRKTSKNLGLSTDASFRFERGCDSEITLWAARRTAQLIAQTCDAEICSGEIDAHPKKLAKKEVEIRFKRVKRILGFDIPQKEVKRILVKLGMEIIYEDDEQLRLVVPIFRPDIEREIDLIEEVARIYGYDNIPSVERVAVGLDAKVDESKFNDDARNYLTSMGFYETVTNSLLNETNAKLFGSPITILNPQSKEMSHARTSLIPGALMTVARNLNVKEKNLKLFEIGKCFNQTSDKINSFDDFVETEELLFILSGKESDSQWLEKEKYFDIYHLKGFAERFFNKLGVAAKLSDSQNMAADDNFEYTLSKKYKGKTIGIGGKISNGMLKRFDIDQDVFAYKIDLGLLKQIPVEEKVFSPLLKFPKVVRDAAFVLDKNIDSGEITKTIYNASSNLLKNVVLFDIFESESIGVGKKSLAFQFEYFTDERTLTEEEVDKDFWNAIDQVKKSFNAELRGG